MSLARDAAEPDALSYASMVPELTGRVEDVDMRQISTEMNLRQLYVLAKFTKITTRRISA